MTVLLSEKESAKLLFLLLPFREMGNLFFDEVVALSQEGAHLILIQVTFIVDIILFQGSFSKFYCPLCLQLMTIETMHDFREDRFS